ncbi:MAG: hypothetical protein IKK75_12400 [Clostridia bacterium]|nr:hypothetical protein [Clostridia bacterium]
MKKMAKLLAVLLMMVLCVSTASASMLGDTYYLEDLHMSMSVPAGYYVFTRDIAANDPVLTALGMNREYVVSFLEENQLYLNAIEENVFNEVTVAMSPNTIETFSGLSDVVLDVVTDAIPEELATQGMNVSKTELYENDEAKFIVIYYTVVDEYGNTNHVKQYFTIYNYQAINFRLFSYVGPLSEADEELLLQVVDSAKFGV